MQLRESLPKMSQFLNRLLAIRPAQQNVLFTEFSNRLEARIRRAELDGNLDRGVETVVAHSCRKVAESVVNVEAASGAETKHVHLILKHKTVAFSFDQVSNGGEATQWQRVEFFARNRQSERVWAFTDAGDRTLPNGSVVPMYYQVGPVSRKPIPKREVNNNRENWHIFVNSPAALNAAREAWDSHVKELPEFTEEDLHLITGAILPIWDRLKGSPRVKRVATDEGERMLGRVIPPEELFDTMSRLVVNSGPPPLKEVVERLLAGTHRFVLANGWVIKRSRVGTEHRIEVLDGVNSIPFAHYEALKLDGLYRERDSGYKLHWYVPSQATESVIAALTKNRPVSKSVRIEAGMVA